MYMSYPLPVKDLNHYRYDVPLVSFGFSYEQVQMLHSWVHIESIINRFLQLYCFISPTCFSVVNVGCLWCQVSNTWMFMLCFFLHLALYLKLGTKNNIINTAFALFQKIINKFYYCLHIWMLPLKLCALWEYKAWKWCWAAMTCRYTAIFRFNKLTAFLHCLYSYWSYM